VCVDVLGWALDEVSELQSCACNRRQLKPGESQLNICASQLKVRTDRWGGDTDEGREC
jgi:hypothetical protein